MMTPKSGLFTSYQNLVGIVAERYGRPAGEERRNEERQEIRAGPKSEKRDKANEMATMTQGIEGGHTEEHNTPNELTGLNTCVYYRG